MKINKICFAVLMGIFALLLIKSILWVFESAPAIKAYLTGDYEKTTANLINKDEKDMATVTYLVNGEEVTATYKETDMLVNKYNQEVEITYCKSNPSKILKIDGMIIFRLLFLYIVYVLIFSTPFFVEIITKNKTKNWESVTYEFIDSKQINEMLYEINFSYEKDGKKKVATVVDGSNIISYLISNKILDGVPLKLEPKNKKRFYLDIEEIKKKVTINKSRVQLD